MLLVSAFVALSGVARAQQGTTTVTAGTGKRATSPVSGARKNATSNSAKSQQRDTTAAAKPQPVDTSAAALVDRAFREILDNPKEAEQLFKQACAKDPTNRIAQSQLGYLYLADKNYPASLERFETAERLRSSDTTLLQIAYLNAQLDRRDTARAILNQLKFTGNEHVRKQAEAQLREMEFTGVPLKTWPRLYSEIFYDSRWKSTFFNVSFQYGEYLDRVKRFGIYAVAMLATDTKSTGGAVPTIISDNTLILGGGVRYNVLPGFFIEAQEGIAYRLLDTPGQRVVNDFRVVGIYGNGIYAPYQYHADARFPFALFGDVYASAGYYNRYHNTIGLLQARPGTRVLEVSHTVADMYLTGRVLFDTRQDFYNNLFEYGAGLRVTPNVNFGLHLVGEYIRGSYLDVSAEATAERELSYEKKYDCARLMLIIDLRF